MSITQRVDPIATAIVAAARTVHRREDSARVVEQGHGEAATDRLGTDRLAAQAPSVGRIRVPALLVEAAPVPSAVDLHRALVVRLEVLAARSAHVRQDLAAAHSDPARRVHSAAAVPARHRSVDLPVSAVDRLLRLVDRRALVVAEVSAPAARSVDDANINLEVT